MNGRNEVQDSKRNAEEKANDIFRGGTVEEISIMENRDRADLLDYVDRRIVDILGRKSIRDLLRNFEEEQYDDEEHKQLRPLSSIYETNDDVIVSVDLPYVSKENIEIDATEDSLLIRARMDRCIDLSQDKDRNKVEFESHCKIIKLPPSIKINVSKARATFRNGVLEIKLPKNRLGTRIHIE